MVQPWSVLNTRRSVTLLRSEKGVLCISPQKGSIQITPPVSIRISANSRKISSTLAAPLAVHGTRSVRLECLHLATFKDDGRLTWILHVTGSDRLIPPIYLSLIDMHVVVSMLRSGRGSFSSRLEIPD
jgi:hypothetical protein